MPLAAPPILTTNVVGGLGNQLFLMANLISTASRHRAAIPDLSVAVPKVSSSDSCGPPRSVYWDSVFQNITTHCGVHLVPSLPFGYQTVVIPETRPVAPVVLPTRSGIRDGSNVAYALTGFFQSHVYFGGSDAEDGKGVVNGGDQLLAQLPQHYRRGARRHLHENYLPSGGSGEPEQFHTVGVHVRRGDYLQMRDVFPILEFDYYDAALRTLLGPALYKAPFTLAPPPRGGGGSTSDVMFPSAAQGRQSIRVLIFSEDVPYATTLAGTWRVKYPGIHVTHVDARHEVVSTVEQSFGEGSGTISTSSSPPREVVELLMLSQCDDLVIANSSYSWWGAYWNRSPGARVVAPTKWFVSDPFPAAAHLYPKDWVLL